ncbi:metal ABC transporter substrate-binding protein [Paenibacillus hamazuiensis]|uniref:metal ABC transporter substrate-binding protein n=1 Tax=Paenibacillus hamazuiensis TaxID=2936508 RepID=UPI00200D37A9|nr:metal ABC transporter substrate-binding protein [Paenibacillus hamazuiensis]
MFKKQVVSIVIMLLVSSLLLSACGGTKQTLVTGKVNVVASFYPLYDFTKKIGGDHVNVINLVPAGVEPHDWSPKSRDMSNLTGADLFIYLGAGFEGWVNDFLGSLKPGVKVKAVEASKGLELLKAAEEEHGHDEGKHEEHESEWDPHVWLSPVNAKKIAQTIKDNLVAADEAHKADYEANYTKFAAQLDELDSKYKSALAQVQKKEIVVSHNSFAYLCKEYGLTQMPIMGLSPDAEPTAKDMQQINAFIKEHNVKYIFFEELVSDKLAKTLAKDAKIETLVLNPLEGLTDKEAQAGQDYLSVMDANLKNLLKALQ